MRRKSIVIKIISLTLSGSILLSSCSSTTMIHSNPIGAKVYLDGEHVGSTPYRHRDSKIVGSTTIVKLEKDGYETLNASFSKDEEADIGAIIGGIFFLFPFLWTMKYKAAHNYELNPSSGIAQNISINTPVNSNNKPEPSKAEKLRELKKLLDEKIISTEEYENEKKKILSKD